MLNTLHARCSLVATATPKRANGQIEAIRVIKIARDTAVKAQTAAIITLKAVLVTTSDELRIEFESLTDHKRIMACAALETNGTVSDPHVATRHTLAYLAQRWLDLHEASKGHRAQLKVLTKTAVPNMLKPFGVGFDTVAEVLVAAGDNTDRIRNQKRPLPSSAVSAQSRLAPARRAGDTGSIGVGTGRPMRRYTEW